MCLAVPGKIMEIYEQEKSYGKEAKISFGGITKSASLMVLPQAKVGDYVLVHVGVAISIVNEEEAQKTFKYLNEIGEVGELEDIAEYMPKKDSDS